MPATLDAGVQALAIRTATEIKTVRNQLTGNNAGSLGALTTTAKGSLVAAINEVNGSVVPTADARVQAARGAINTPSTTQWASTQAVIDHVAAQITALIGGAPTALDTLVEIANALGNNANLASTLTTQIANKVDFGVQTLTSPQQAQARANIGAVAASDIGSTSTDYVALFETGLA